MRTLFLEPLPSGVEEILERRRSWLGLADGEYKPIEQSTLIGLGPKGLAEQIDWP